MLSLECCYIVDLCTVGCQERGNEFKHSIFSTFCLSTFRTSTPNRRTVTKAKRGLKLNLLSVAGPDSADPCGEEGQRRHVHVHGQQQRRHHLCRPDGAESPL